MKIDHNPTEKKAMSLFIDGNTEEAHALQDVFLDEVRRFIASGGDHCSCTVACKHHGNCLDCVTLHRGHRNHLPECLKEV